MKKVIAGVISLMLIFCCSVALAADKYGGYEVPVDISVNGNFIKCEGKPILINNRAYIPLRAFSDAVGGSISWDDGLKAATFTKNNKKFVFYAGKNYSVIDGNESGYGAVIHKELMFVPVRAVSEALNYGVEWDSQYLVVKINAPGVSVSRSLTDYSYSYNDIELLSKITNVEGGSQSFKTKVGIAQTVVNRVKSPLFPGTVKDVIFDTKYGVQFPPAHTELMNRTPSKACVIAAKCALNGVNVVGNALYFTSTKSAPGSWAHNNREYSTTLGGIAFYL